MFFIESHNPDDDSYVIVDTDDGSRESHSLSDLKYFASLGISVIGFSVNLTSECNVRPLVVSQNAIELFAIEVLKEVKRTSFKSDSALFKYIIESFTLKITELEKFYNIKVGAVNLLEGVTSVLQMGYGTAKVVLYVSSLGDHISKNYSGDLAFFNSIVLFKVACNGVVVYVLKNSAVLVVGDEVLYRISSKF